MIADTLQFHITKALDALDIAPPEEIGIEHPDELAHGDYASNVAMVLASEVDTGPRELAEEIVNGLRSDMPDGVESVEIADPGFINFTLTDKFLAESLKRIINDGDSFGSNNLYENKKKIFEYTTQNLMKEFHVGHLMSHVIGNAIANIHEFKGAEVKRNSYQGDVGMHIAKVVWAIWKDKDSQEPFPDDVETPQEKANYLGKKYAFGDKMYDPEDLAGFSEGKEQNKKEIEEINKKIYKESDPEINEIYEKARKWSLESYEEIYDRLGVELGWQFFESETAPVGKEIVKEGVEKGVFEKSDGAIVYDGEKKGLHTRVFINSDGIPTYEAKDLGLMKVKHEAYSYDEAIVFTANEQNEYFQVVLSAAEEALPDIGKKTTHIGHGTLELSSGKMSSRSGEVLPANKLLDDLYEKAYEKIADRIEGDTKHDTAESIAQAAVRYEILKQDVDKNVTFDIEEALSFEGNSGPYLQYTYVRAQSILQEANCTADQLEKIEAAPSQHPEVARILYRFPSVVQRSAHNFTPQFVAGYLYSVAKSFNTYYGNTKIIADDTQIYRLALTAATAQVLKNGLRLLGIETPKKM
jgi:arginyl-tRNA synthetase